MTLEVFIPNYPNTTFYWVNLKIENSPPKFEGTLPDVDIGLYWKKDYKLPKIIDPDGGQVSVRYGPTSLSDFVKFD